ncbi:hypothetical protein BBO99_00007374 [Phytophthora kernoviae]|uniref:Uncharacterized protein n=2 Tax=Phytophthora kernoviae TaxID=325452 RepID=A0A3R7HFA8_9STRA|nr:hypothetical protein G195_006929 [Phytophthora kernoviae 00238/432]KAG2521184.1 hypothetical protein JM16_005927 [Phytophthora kernoviae]KAG2522759.1 hypothetical protein JM18_005617 [Phytophthora kernoviae]RLN02361.1 hypothetical protein BBI17_007329 [Phytophthora kernoviae]RLN76653.1 hypothetical protein BBO99_00007374 [Phytophthora kernoviae]
MATDVSANAAEKAQAFAHRLVEFADYDVCIKYFNERHVDFNRPNNMGWSILMSVCACGRDDLVGFVVDRTTALECATTTNRTTVLHLAAMSKNPRVMQGLVATTERREKLRKVVDQPNAHGDTALMMACVAKSIRAVQLLLELGASLTAVNASGLNALMCASRACNDPRPGAPSHDELTARSATIAQILLARGADCEEEAALVSTQVEQELMELAVKEAEGASGRKQTATTKTGKKKGRKESVGEKTVTLSTKTAKRSQRKGGVSTKVSEDTPPGSSKAVKTPSRTVQDAIPRSAKAAAMSPSLPPKVMWVNQAVTNVKQSPILSPRSQEGSEEEEAQSVASAISYDILNSSFQRTFPVAADLEIGVEKFLIASSMSGRELEPNDNLSISQVEALQEAHWQAYHYLNEKKIELTRLLEAQRVEAQFTLQQELMQMK